MKNMGARLGNIKLLISLFKLTINIFNIYIFIFIITRKESVVIVKHMEYFSY